ncbi:hypothetical protein IHE45_16G007600, partial [Dioscorea alata]
MVRVFPKLGSSSNKENIQMGSSNDQREASAGNPPPAGAAAMELRPIEHPSEPPQYDKPITCPQPEPPILY